ncbi:TPA: hypothetical protein IAB95_05570, partial [Candidatus Ventrenecus avicola]|nr:hypothetical protein [Candidatus Ventrenecus avicola]
MNNSESTYLYDGTWEDLLTLVFWLFSKRIKPFGIKSEDQYGENLLYPAIKPMIERDFSYSKKSVSKDIWHILFFAFLTNESD